MRLLHGVTVLGRPLEPMLAGATRGLPPADAALARALASEALRHLTALDQQIDSACRRPLPPDARARHVLRVALAGHHRLGTPAHAVVSTALPLVEGGPRRLVHGLLSTLLRQRTALAPPQLPPPVAARWSQSWGPATVAAARALFAEPPPLDLCLQDPQQTDLWAARLEGVSLMPGHVRLRAAGPVPQLPGFAEGAWWVQDLAAQLPARLIDARPGQKVADLCAAPGGKTLQLCAGGAEVVAVDQSGARLAQLRDNLQRTGLRATVVEADARQVAPDASFDAVLLDAPCSATGTFRRHPDVLWRGAPDLAALVPLQADLLAHAAGLLRPGGTLVYAVCSLEPAEGAGHAAPAGTVVDPIRPAELPPGLEPSSDGGLILLPGRWHAADGFQIRRFRRV